MRNREQIKGSRCWLANGRYRMVDIRSEVSVCRKNDPRSVICNLIHFFILITLFFLGTEKQLQAQNGQPKFEHYTPVDGLSQATVRLTYQDTKGYIWFGTNDGLNRFDGTNFKVYQNIPEDETSISGNNIRAIYEEDDQGIWIGTLEGLNFLDLKTDRFKRYLAQEGDTRSIMHNEVKDIIGDQNGDMWIGTGNGMLSKYNKALDQFEHFIEPNRSEPNDLMLASDGRIWISYEDLRLVVFDPQLRQFTTVLNHFKQEPLCLLEDEENRIWIGTDGDGLVIYDPNKQDFLTFLPNRENPKSISSNTIWDILLLKGKQELLLATDGGINRVTLPGKTIEKLEFTNYRYVPRNAFSIASDFIISVYEDRQGIIWAGTSESGVDKWDRNIQKFEHYNSQAGHIGSLSNNTVWGIWEDAAEKIWIGTSNGLNVLDRKKNEVKAYFHKENNPNSISHNRIWCFLPESDQKVWLGTSGGLNLMTIQKNGVPTFSSFQHDPRKINSISANSVLCLYLDDQNNFWVGTNDGLNRFNRQSGTFQRIYHNPEQPGSISSDYIRTIFQDSKGRLWIGTANGLNRYNYDQDNFEVLLHDENHASSLSHNYIRVIFEDRQGQLWIGTSNGLNKVHFDQGTDNVAGLQFQHFFEKDGLPNNVIYAIEEDEEGLLWMSTNNGLSQLYSKTEQFTNYQYRDGLQSKEFNQQASYKNDKGELFFGGINGFNIFKPSDLNINTVVPTVVFTDFKINYHDVEIGTEGPLKMDINWSTKVELGPDDRTFYIGFSALNFTRPEENQYAFKLEPFEENWNEVAQQNFALYTNIPPGDYTFQVKAANNDGIWNETGKSVKIHIQPAFWQTLWFKLIILFSLVTLVWGIYKMRVQNLVKNQHLLEEKVKERTSKIREQKERLENAFEELKSAQAQLIHSEKMASLGQLTAGIAHEINNPINFIASNVQALKLDFKDIEALLKKVSGLSQCNNAEECVSEIIKMSGQIDSEYLREEIGALIAGIERGAERTQNIVNSLRTFSYDKKEAFSEADINEGLDSTLIILSSKLKDGIELYKNYGELPKVKCQISKLNQVFLNIINNAIQAVDKKGAIYIKTSQSNGFVQIMIRDTGKGMDEPTKNRIFEPFFTTKEVGEGTGLGLSISYGIIEQHGGQIKVNSEPEKGTEFIIQLPVESQL